MGCMEMGRGSGRRGHRGREGGGCRNVTREPALAEGISSAAPPSLRHSLLGLAGHQRRPPPLPTPPSCLSSPLPSLDGPFSPATPWQLPPPPQAAVPAWTRFHFPPPDVGKPQGWNFPSPLPTPQVKALDPPSHTHFLPCTDLGGEHWKGGWGAGPAPPSPCCLEGGPLATLWAMLMASWLLFHALLSLLSPNV